MQWKNGQFGHLKTKFRAERENEAEKKNNKSKIVEKIKQDLENNIDLESSKLFKK